MLKTRFSKLLKISALLMIGMLCMCSCSEESGDSRTGSPVKDSDSPVEEGAALLTQNSGNTGIAQTDSGMYRISYEEIMDGKWGQKIYYVDYASAQEVVLCNNASCKHDNENCMGIIMDDAIAGSPELFVYHDKLYVFKTQDDSGSMEIVTDTEGILESPSFPSKLYEMNLDGTDRHVAMEFPEEATIGEQVFSYNGKLVFCQKKIKSETNKNGETYHSAVETKLITLDAAKGTTDELIKLPDGLTISGASGDSLVCQKTVYPDGYTQKEADSMDYNTWRDLMDHSTEQITLVSLQTGESQVLWEGSTSDGLGAFIMNDHLYLPKDNSTIAAFNLESKDKKNIKMDADYELISQLGDRIYCWKNGNPDERYCWDPETNSLSEFSMNIKGTGLPLEILAYNDDSILAVCDGKIIFSSDGSYEFESSSFGIIKKEDLYRGETGYTPVKMCSKGWLL